MGEVGLIRYFHLTGFSIGSIVNGQVSSSVPAMLSRKGWPGAEGRGSNSNGFLALYFFEKRRKN